MRVRAMLGTRDDGVSGYLDSRVLECIEAHGRHREPVAARVQEQESK